MPTLRRLVAAAANMLTIVTIVAGPPTILMHYGVEAVVSRIVELRDAPGGQLSEQHAQTLLILFLGVVWLLLVLSLLVEVAARVRGFKAPRLALLHPLQGLAATLIAGQAASLLTPAASLAAPLVDPAAPPPSVAAPPATATSTHSSAEGAAVMIVGQHRYTYLVKRGDHLSKISAAWLGDAARWPEICKLNWHRHFPKVGGTLRDCNLIYPGWSLRLPADARPPAGVTPAKPPAQTTPPVSGPRSGTPSTSPSACAASPSPAGTPCIDPSVAPGVPAPQVANSPAATSPVATAPPPRPTLSHPPSSAPANHDSQNPAVTTDEHGVQLSPTSWVPWGVAVAVSAAAMVVWLQRRRRYTGDPDHPPPTELPPSVVALRRAVARNEQLPRPDTDDSEPLASVPDLTLLPPGGTGLVGEGAHAAARAALVAVLASGDAHHPDSRGEVVTDAATLATLLGPDGLPLGRWPRLHVVDTVDDALTMVESRLLHRSRILDEHSLTDLDTLRQTVPDEEALPPVLLLTTAPPADASTRTRVALALGGDLQVCGLLLGEWAGGLTVEVAPDGHTQPVHVQTADAVPSRLPVLDQPTTIHVLTTLREAQTGEPPNTSPTDSDAMPLYAADTETSRTGAAVTAAETADTGFVRARLRVLGPPHIEGITTDGRPLRAKALELAVFLAVHPDGAETRTIGDNIELDARISQAAQRVHTNASNLRHVLSRAGTAEAHNAYVVKTAGRYRLDPATVDVDVWAMRDLLRAAAIASGDKRRELLTAACDLYTGHLAEGQAYEWLQPHREAVRRWGIEAHLLLADDLLAGDPQRASDLLDKAIGLDRYNEALYVAAIRARHALGDADGIRTLLRTLAKALNDLDAEPQEDTIALAAHLRNSLQPNVSASPIGHEQVGSSA